MTEQQIIKACVKNDRLGQRRFVNEYSAYLMKICLRYSMDKELAKDCLQESLVHILKNISKYKEQGNFKAWISRVTSNKCLEILRKEKKFAHDDVTEMYHISHPETVNIRMETDSVLEFMNGLPYKYRIALSMYLVEGYNHKEIGDFLQINESTSRSLVARGRKKIQDHFKSESLQVIHKSETANSKKKVVKE